MKTTCQNHSRLDVFINLPAKMTSKVKLIQNGVHLHNFKYEVVKCAAAQALVVRILACRVCDPGCVLLAHQSIQPSHLQQQ